MVQVFQVINMWVAELKLWHKESAILEHSRGLNARVTAYYLNTFQENGETYSARAAAFYGPDSKKLQEAFENDSRAHVLSKEGNQMFYAVKQTNSFHSTMMNKTVFLIKPVSVKDGFEYLTVASWDKEYIKRFYDSIKALGSQNAKVEMLSMKESDLNLFLPTALLTLTDLQRKALESAVENGFYDFPRKNDLEQIAKINKTPRTTFQNHLRKAEEKIMPAVIDQNKV